MADERKKEKKKWRYVIATWMGKAHEGYWVPVAIATNLKSSYERHTRGKSMENRGQIIVEKVTELVYAHGGYHPKFEDEADTRKAFFWHGARIFRK